MQKLLKMLSLTALLGLPLAPVARAEGFAGAFLAAKSADFANDYAQAAHYYTQALAAEPESVPVMQGALFALVESGDVLGSVAIARKMVAAGVGDEFSQTVLIAQAFSSGNFKAALALLADPSLNLNPLIRKLATGWGNIGQGDVKAAMAAFEKPSDNQAITAFGLYNKGLALAYLGKTDAANGVFQAGNAYVNRGAVLAHAQILSTLGRTPEALSLMVEGAGASFGDRESDALRQRLHDGDSIVFNRIQRPQDGVADIFFVLADALKTDKNNRLALYYARLATFLRPDDAEALLLTGDILTAQTQFSMALNAYDAVPENDPLALDAKLGRARNLRFSGQLEKAADTLRKALKQQPDDISMWQSLANILRENNKLAKSKVAYTTAIGLLPAADIRAAWRLFYARGIGEQRAGDWPAAEADFRHALVLNPKQADVLNYLGYTLVDRGEKLDEALGMIETAAAARPQSGAIADSLGWVYYRLGRYNEAVTAMQNAVKLLPVDPILSDHYGDVLWMVDRKREARFQWRRALSFGPEPQDAGRIRDKLARGLDAVLADE